MPNCRWHLPQVHKTAFGKEDDVAPRGHGESVNLGLDVDDLLSVGLEPSNVNLDIEVANAGKCE